MSGSAHLTEAEKDLRREQIRSLATLQRGNRAKRRNAARRLLKQRALQDQRQDGAR